MAPLSVVTSIFKVMYTLHASHQPPISLNKCKVYNVIHIMLAKQLIIMYNMSYKTLSLT